MPILYVQRMKKILESFLEKYPSLSISDLTQDFSTANAIKHSLWIKELFTISLNKKHPVIVHNDILSIDYRVERVSEKNKQHLLIYQMRTG